MRTLAMTQNVTLDGSIEMLGDWFNPQGQAGQDNSDLLEEVHRQDSKADGLLAGRRTFEDLRGYWPTQSEDPTGITTYLNRVQKYVVSSTMTHPGWQNSTVLRRSRRGGPRAEGTAGPGHHRHRQHHAVPPVDRGRLGR